MFFINDKTLYNGLTNKFEEITIKQNVSIPVTANKKIYNLDIEGINKLIEDILYKVINYYTISDDRISLQSNIQEILNNLVLILIKMNIKNNILINKNDNKTKLDSEIKSLNNITQIYTNQIKLN